jgi:hypothetical protein
VREGGVGGEVFLDRGALGAGWGLREGVDDVGDFGDCGGGVSYGVEDGGGGRGGPGSSIADFGGEFCGAGKEGGGELRGN